MSSYLTNVDMGELPAAEAIEFCLRQRNETLIWIRSQRDHWIPMMRRAGDVEGMRLADKIEARFPQDVKWMRYHHHRAMQIQRAERNALKQAVLL